MGDNSVSSKWNLSLLNILHEYVFYHKLFVVIYRVGINKKITQFHQPTSTISTTMQGRVDEMGALLVCSYLILIWTYICNMYQQQVQHQIETLSSHKGRGGNIIDGKHSYSREQLINLRPGFNMRLLNTEQVTKINEYGLK